MSQPICVLDACVLVPPGLRDLLLSLADASLFRPVWQSTILDEVRRNGVELMIRRGRDHDDAATLLSRVLQQMAMAFPDGCLEDDDWMPRLPECTNDLKDRHVVAAALAAQASHLVTENLPDFPAQSLPQGLQAMTADDFLLEILALDPDGVLDGIGRMAARHRRPAHSVGELCELIARDSFTRRFGTLLLQML